MRRTFLLRAYAALTRIALPIAWWIERRKLARAGLPLERQREKLGFPSALRPDAPLVWFHAASVGESLSVLSLIEAMGTQRPDLEFLITSGTPTSAKLVMQRMPARARHQFAPLDAPSAVGRFLAAWRPNAVLFVESELWPNMLMQVSDTSARLALVNARLSERSIEGWKKYPDTAKCLLSKFQLILTQNPKMRGAMVEMGANPDRVQAGFNLKSLASALPIDADLVAEMRAELQGRPVWVASSTHPGEEEIVLEAHAKLLETQPDLLLILAPRHPERSAEVANLIEARGWTVRKRSHEDAPDQPVYLADTLGELGSWYALTSFVFLGGSLVPLGGHNPFEVAQSGAAVLSGPRVHNFSETYAPLVQVGGAVLVHTAQELADHSLRWLTDQSDVERAQKAAASSVSDSHEKVNAVAKQLISELNL